MHWHDSIELLYFKEGEADIKCDDNAFHVKAGDLAVVNINQLHTVNPASEFCLYHCFIIPQELFDNRDINIYTASFSNLVSGDDELSCLFDRVTEEFKLNKASSKLAIKGQLYNIFAHLLRYHKDEGSQTKPHRKKILGIIKSSLLYMENNFQKSVSLDEICQKEGLSKYYFCRMFKEAVGQSPIEYLNLLRINKAAELLKSGSYNVSEAAEMCGFNNINYFSKVFKKYKNTLPSSIKKM